MLEEQIEDAGDLEEQRLYLDDKGWIQETSAEAALI